MTPSPSPGSGRRSQGWGDSPDRRVKRSGQLDALACTAAGGLGSAVPPAMPPLVNAQWTPGGSWTLERTGGRTQELGRSPPTHWPSVVPSGGPWIQATYPGEILARFAGLLPWEPRRLVLSSRPSPFLSSSWLGARLSSHPSSLTPSLLVLLPGPSPQAGPLAAWLVVLAKSPA